MDFGLDVTQKISSWPDFIGHILGGSRGTGKTLIFISPDGGGSDFIRVVSPFMKNPLLDGMDVYCIRSLFDGARDSRVVSPHYLKSHEVTFLVARNKISEKDVEELFSLKRDFGCRVIVDLDDDLFAIDESHPQYAEYVLEQKKLERLIALCDLLVASTPEVVSGVRGRDLCPNSVVLPNYLDDRIWVWGGRLAESSDSAIRVLYSGTETHDADLKMIADYFPNIEEEVRSATGRELEIHVVGGTLLELSGLTIHGVPDDCRRYDRYVRWLCSLGDFDFAMAPLCLDNKLNHAKSNLKFLEYSAMGLPCIFTAIEPYDRTVENGVDGFLVKNNSKRGWVDAFVSLASSQQLRASMARAATKKLDDSLLLSQHFGDWANLV